MKAGTLEYWAKLGWQLDPVIVHGLGEVVNTGNGPYYVGDQHELGYDGLSRPMVPSRFAMGMMIGRQLKGNEVLRFIGEDKKDLRLSNVVFHSKTASSAELLKANGVPVLGYSHCLCGCGTELDLEIQALQPYAYAAGHRPQSKRDKNLKRARPPMAKVLVEKVLSEKIIYEEPKLIPIPEPETEVIEDQLKIYRALFERMIHNLPWEEFKQLLTLLLEIHAGKGKP